MGLFTKLTPAEISQICKQFNLPSPLQTKGILEGTVNTYYRLSYPADTYYLKIDEVRDLKRLNKELKILTLLHKKRKALGYETPTPLLTKALKPFLIFKGKPILIFKEIAGTSYFGTKLNSKKLLWLGAALGKLHRATVNTHLAPHRFQKTELRRVFRSIKERLVKKHPRLVKFIEDELKKNLPANLPVGLIHADLFPENVLYQGTRVNGILDFEASGKGEFIFDISVALHALCHDGKKFNLKKISSFMKGYEKQRPLKMTEIKCWEASLRLAALRFLLTRLRDFELKEGPLLSTFKDFKEFVIRFEEIGKLLPHLR